MNSNERPMAKQIWPALIVGTLVVAGIALVGRWQTEGIGEEAAGGGINKRKNFLRYNRENYGYPAPS